MVPRRSLLAFALSVIATLLLGFSEAQKAVPTTASPGRPVRPKPIILTPSTAKPPVYKPTKPPNGGNQSPPPPQLPSPNYYLFPPCTDADKAPQFADASAPQCKQYSGYSFGGILPTTAQKTLLCGEGCWPLIDHIMGLPVPSCSLVLSNIAINYIDALYVIFGDCVADAAKANVLPSTSVVNPAVTPAPAAVATPKPGSAPVVSSAVPTATAGPVGASGAATPSPAPTTSAASARYLSQLVLVISVVMVSITMAVGI